MLLIVIYTTSIFVVLPECLYTNYLPYPGKKDHWICESTMSFNFTQVYTIAQVTIATFIPLLIISITQHQAYKSLKKSSEQFGIDERRIRVMKKVLNKFIVVIVVFFLFTTPISVLTLFLQWYADPSKLDYDLINDSFSVLDLLMTVNSCANPIIYGGLDEKVVQFINSHFRKRAPEQPEHIEETSMSTLH